MHPDIKEYLDYTKDGIQGKLTRAVVISVRDPLFSGRVKVWIPTLHGGMTAPGIDDLEGDEDSQEQLGKFKLMGTNTGSDKLDSLIDTLPWASVVNPGWGSTGNPWDGSLESDFGLYNIPKKGTEVWIIFEDDDIDKPVIIGSIGHSPRFLSTEANSPIQISPGNLIAEVPSSDQLQALYETTVSQSYVITSQGGGYFVLSDAATQQQIKLGARTPLAANPLVPTDGDKYKTFTANYPNFPSTSSAPFAITAMPNAIGYTKFQSITSTQADLATSGPASAATIPTQHPDVSKPIQKSAPIIASYPAVTGSKAFKASRNPNRLHAGVDLSVPIGTPLIAPIDCIVVGYSRSISAGTMLLVRGIDGIGHAFLHLDSVLPSIIKDVTSTPPIYRSYKRGDSLGTCGNTGANSKGPHLHWEVFTLPEDAKTGADVANFRYAALKQGALYKGQAIPQYSPFMDPLKDWLKGAPAGHTIEIVLSPNQLGEFTNSTQQALTDRERVIGLEMSLVKGGESIFLRHPSGAFLGFDADGNFQLYTPGDANFKVNRSVIWDVLGGIMTNCLAVYQNIKAVFKLSAPSQFFRMQYNGKEFPDVFDKINQTRLLDMQDALASSTDNIYYSLVNSSVSKTLDEIKRDGSTLIDTSKFTMSSWPNAKKYQNLVSKAYTSYITKSNNFAVKTLKDGGALTEALFLAIIAKESNNNPNKTNTKSGAVGLMQLRSAAVQQIKKDSNPNMQVYFDPEKNIDLGVQYFVYLCTRVMTETQKVYDVNNRTLAFTPEQCADMVKIALMGYNAGEGTIISGYYRRSLVQTTVPSYASVESEYFQNYDNTEKKKVPNSIEALAYAPTVTFIQKNLTS